MHDPLLLAYYDLWPLSGHIFQYKMQVMTWADTRILKDVSNEYEHMSTKFHIKRHYVLLLKPPKSKSSYIV